MTLEKWQQLEALCREAWDEADEDLKGHDTYQAVALCGAFAASIASHMADA